MNVFIFAANAVAPIVILMLVGYFLKLSGAFKEEFFKLGNKLVFRAALPVMLFFNIYNVEALSDINWVTVIFAIAITLILFAAGFVSTLLIKDKNQKGVIWQNFFRANTAIIGIPLAVSLGGEEALPVISILSAFCVTAYNVLSIVALSLYTDGGKKSSAGDFIKKMLTNPLLIAIVAGLFVVFVRSLLPVDQAGEPVFTIKEDLPFVYTALELLSNMTTPFSLIVLGGLFSFSAVRELKRQIIIGTVSRIVIAPVIGIGLALLLKDVFNFGAPEFAAFVSMFCPPAAVSGLAMAAEMKNDDRLAGQLVVWTTVFSIFTIYFTTVILKFCQVI